MYLNMYENHLTYIRDFSLYARCAVVTLNILEICTDINGAALTKQSTSFPAASIIERERVRRIGPVQHSLAGRLAHVSLFRMLRLRSYSTKSRRSTHRASAVDPQARPHQRVHLL